MGKAAKREKARRRRYFQRLSETNPQRFEMEWEKRLSSWLIAINKDAGRLSNHKGETIPPVFSIVDEAMGILEACSQEIFGQYAKKTFRLLTTQCCIAFSAKAVSEIYRPSNYQPIAAALRRGGRHLSMCS